MTDEERYFQARLNKLEAELVLLKIRIRETKKMIRKIKRRTI